MAENYHEEVVASMIQKSLSDLSFMCGESVVLRGIRLYLLSHDKDICNLGSFTSINVNVQCLIIQKFKTL